MFGGDLEWKPRLVTCAVVCLDTSKSGLGVRCLSMIERWTWWSGVPFDSSKEETFLHIWRIGRRMIMENFFFVKSLYDTLETRNVVLGGVRCLSVIRRESLFL